MKSVIPALLLTTMLAACVSQPVQQPSNDNFKTVMSKLSAQREAEDRVADARVAKFAAEADKAIKQFHEDCDIACQQTPYFSLSANSITIPPQLNWDTKFHNTLVSN